MINNQRRRQRLIVHELRDDDPLIGVAQKNDFHEMFGYGFVLGETGRGRQIE